MVGVSKKLYNGVVEYLTETTDKLRQDGSARALQIMEGVLDVLAEPAKDNFERLVTLAAVSETVGELAGTALLLSKLGMHENVDTELYIYGAITGVCNLTLTLSGATNEKVKAYLDELEDAVVITEEQVPA